MTRTIGGANESGRTFDRSGVLATAALAAGLVLAPACASAPPGTESPAATRTDPEPHGAAEPGTEIPGAAGLGAEVELPAIEWQRAGESVRGAPIRYVVLGDGPEAVLLVATLHGDESAGTPLLERLARELAADPEALGGRTVVIVPEANPDGRAARRRTNAHGIDLNRNFPAADHEAEPRHGADALSEPESRALFELIERHAPARVVSLHQPLACVDFDGPGEGLASAIAAASPLRVARLGTRPGSLGSWLGTDRSVPTVTLELPRGASRLDADELWRTYGPALLAAVRFE